MSLSPGGAAGRRQALLDQILRSKGITAPAGTTAIPRRATPGRAPLSFAQQRLWFLEQLEPGTSAYNVLYPARLTGPLDVAALKAALDGLVRRHEILRTTFSDEDGAPVQVVAPVLQAPLVVEEAAAEPERLAREEAARPFDLRRSPPFRVRVLKYAEREHVLLLCVHHTAADGWSLGLLLGELGALYEAALSGREAAPAPLPIQYADYAAWQRSVQAEQMDHHLSYWRGRLAGLPELLQFPLDHARPAVQSSRGARYRFLLPSPLPEAAEALARKEGATLFMVLLAAFQVLLHRYSGQDDIVVGTPIANRTRAETEAVVGCFVNPLVLRVSMSGDPSFRALLGQVRERCLEAYAHQDLPFERLVEELRPRRSLQHAPLFQVMFALQNAPAAALALHGVVVERLPVDTGVAAFDFTLDLERSARGLEASFEYCADLFDAATIQRMALHYATLLEGLAAAPDRSVAEISMAGAEERRLLVEWSQAAPLPPLDGSVQDAFSAQAARTPAAVAVQCGEATLTYRELDERSNRLASHLRALGVGPETVVGMCLERSIELAVGLLGILKAGGAYLPLDPTAPPERLRLLVEATGGSVVLARGSAAALAAGRGRRVLRLDAGWPEIAREPPSPVDCTLDGEGLASVIYTSGSTGRPKGVLIRHRALLARGLACQRHYALGPDDRVLQFASPSFDVAAEEIFPTWMVGGAVVMWPRPAPPDLDEFPHFLARHGITVVNLPATYWHLWAADVASARSFLPSSLRLVIVGSEAVLPERLAQWWRRTPRSVGWLNAYGPTEATITATLYAPPDPPPSEGAAVPIGRPILGVRAYALDRRLRPVPVSVPGELYIGGPGLARGYLGDPTQTAERFVPDPFGAEPGARMYRTGDRVRWHPDGTLAFLGRSDHQVKVRGFRIELEEIEAALERQPGVSAAVAAVHEVEPGNPVLVGYVVPEKGTGISVDGLRGGLQALLPQYMVPSAFVTLPELPQTPSQKIDRRALPPPAAARATVPAGSLPRSELERRIAGVWCQALGAAQVGIHDNFFDLGGHSLLMLQVHRRLRDETGLQLSVLDLFSHPTIAALAAHASGTPEAHPPAPAAREPSAGGTQAVAIVGMSGRFPGANTLAAFWENLLAAKESIRRFSAEELRALGVPEARLAHPAFVGAGARLEGEDLFDAGLFGYTPREAEFTDPQHRVLLECAWEALEHAGHSPSAFPGKIGVFAGSSTSAYWIYNLLPRGDGSNSNAMQVLIGSDRDHLATTISYKLGLKGPSLTVQTACSTSLVAVNLACKSLSARECDAALAGGVSIGVPQRIGYTYEAGGILSPDGHCRPFGAEAQGTVAGDGVGVVVLRRLEDALRDGDTIYAVIRGSAINNDGSAKVGYTAPSIEGQAEVIAEAQAAAGVSPDSIGYVEAHGTGTTLGDPIEVAALTLAMRRGAGKVGYCALGSVKGNIGHLDVAAGVAGLIKAALALYHEEIPPTLHGARGHPDVLFESSPFYLPSSAVPWRRSPAPRRAGVSSFGIGGTNAHVVLEEAPPPREAAASTRPCHLLLLSAQTEEALDVSSEALAAHLRRTPSTDLADVAFTLALGRRELPYRKVVVASSAADAVEALASRAYSAHQPLRNRTVSFLFPGQGAQHPGMAAVLYRTEPLFRDTVDLCSRHLLPHLGFDLREAVFSTERNASARLTETAVAQPALFTVEYALAQLWMSWGVRPAVLLGHSLGEYAAACLAGVFSLPDALFLVALRGRLVQTTPPGTMLGVPLPEAELTPLLDASLSLAAVNAPSACVVAGSTDSIQRFAQALSARGVQSRLLHTSHAFHSSLIEPVLAPFREALARVRLHAPRLPLVSSLHGRPLAASEATDPDYWVHQLREPVRFADGLASLAALDDGPLLEVGPSNALGALARLHPATASRTCLASLRHPSQPEADDASIVPLALARLWLAGVSPDWSAFHGSQLPRRRLPLPTYPFQRARYWLDPPGATVASGAPGLQVKAPVQRHARPNHAKPYEAPRNPLEQRLASLWEELFGLSPIGIQDDFFELGGDSLLATQLLASLQDALQLQIPLSVLFNAPTIASLAVALEALPE
jgi:amino acid adenylation domain-containing protein